MAASDQLSPAPSDDNSNSLVPATPPPGLFPLVPEMGATDTHGELDLCKSPAGKSSGEAADTTQAVEDVGYASDMGDKEDIFCDASGCKAGSMLDEAVRRAAAQKGLSDAYDDPEGYYNFQFGEILGQRYEVFASKGKGVFSTVIRAWDKHRKGPEGKHPEVAIKILRSNEVMRKSGQMEEQILKRLAAADPDNKHHCIALLSSFEYRGHLCLVFEPMVCVLCWLHEMVGYLPQSDLSFLS